MSDWGQGAKNNDIGWGQGSVNNGISWGAVHADSWAGDTDIVGFAYDSTYQSVLDYGTSLGYTLPSDSQKLLQNQLLIDLKTAGVWSKLDTFANFATDGDSNFALIDWKRLTLLTAVNSPTFTTNKGFTGNGTSSYINTNFNPSTQGVNYTQNNAGVSIGVFAIPTIGNYALGTALANTGDIRIRMMTSLSDQMINGTIQATASGLNSNVTGSLHTDRINSTQIVSQVNNTLGSIATNNSTGVPQSNIWLGRIVTLYANMGFNYLAIRSSFSKTEKDVFNGIINTYITSL